MRLILKSIKVKDPSQQRGHAWLGTQHVIMFPSRSKSEPAFKGLGKGTGKAEGRLFGGITENRARNQNPNRSSFFTGAIASLLTRRKQRGQLLVSNPHQRLKRAIFVLYVLVSGLQRKL